MFTKFRINLDKKGFTLIELLIVVAIIGILAAIAIPQFGAYRRRGYNAAANSDLRTVRTTQEAMFADFQDYGVTSLTDVTGTPKTGEGATTTAGTAFFLCGDNTTTTCQNISPSPNVAVEASAFAAGGKNTHYNAVSKHTSGDTIYGVDSISTGLYRKAGTAGTALAALDLTAPTDATSNTMSAAPWITMQ